MLTNFKNLLIIMLMVIGQLANYHLTLNVMAASMAAAVAAAAPMNITSQHLQQSQQQQQQQNIINTTTVLITKPITTTTTTTTTTATTTIPSTTNQPTHLPLYDATTINEIKITQEQQQQQLPQKPEIEIMKVEQKDLKQLDSSVIQMIPQIRNMHNNNNGNNNLLPLNKNDNISTENLLDKITNQSNVNQINIEFKSNSNVSGHMETITEKSMIMMMANATIAIADKTDINQNKSENEIVSIDDLLEKKPIFNKTKEIMEITTGRAASERVEATTIAMYNLLTKMNESSEAATIPTTLLTTTTPTITTLREIFKTPPIPITNFIATTTALPHLMKMKTFVEPVLENFTIVENNYELEEMISTTEAAAAATELSVVNVNQRYKNNNNTEVDGNDDDDDDKNFGVATTIWPSNDYIINTTTIAAAETTMDFSTRDADNAQTTATTINDNNMITFPFTESVNDFLNDEITVTSILDEIIETSTLNEITETTTTTPTTTTTTITAIKEAAEIAESAQTTQIQHEEFVTTLAALLPQITTTAAITTTTTTATTTTTNDELDNLPNNLFTTEETLQKTEYKVTTPQNTGTDAYSTTTEIFDNPTTMASYINLNGLKVYELDAMEITAATNRSRRILEAFNNVTNNMQQIKEDKFSDDSNSSNSNISSAESNNSNNNNDTNQFITLSTTSINKIEEYDTTTTTETASTLASATTIEYITTEWPDMEYTTFTASPSPSLSPSSSSPTTTTATTTKARSRNLPPSKLEHSRNSDGVEMFYGYSVVAHNQ